MNAFVVLEGNYALNVDSLDDAKAIAQDMARKSNDVVRIIALNEVVRPSDMVCDVFMVDCNGDMKKVSE